MRKEDGKALIDANPHHVWQKFALPVLVKEGLNPVCESDGLFERLYIRIYHILFVSQKGFASFCHQADSHENQFVVFLQFLKKNILVAF